MSTSPSFPLNNDLVDRPLSVYDNLTSNQIPNGVNKEYPRTAASTITNGDPLKNITFKFDDHEITSNGNAAKLDQTTLSAIRPAVHNPSKSSPGKMLISANTAPGVNYTGTDAIETSQGLAASTVSAPSKEQQSTNKSSLRSAVIGSSATMPDLDRDCDRAGTLGVGYYKPVISDAKSRFFGLTSDSSGGDQSACNGYSMESPNVPLLNGGHTTSSQPECNPAEHKYQNIPANSAIFRKHNESNGRNETQTHATPAIPTIVTTDLSAPEYNDLPDHPNSSSADGKSDRRRNTNSFHGDSDLNYTQQPSQIIYMATTVPQNIKSPNIAGRHTPTRNSLRHSRMLVVNKNYNGTNGMNPLGLKHPKIARVLLIILLILGLIITSIGIWILLWAPYTRMQDNPYWSGLSLVLAATLGLIVTKFKRIKRQKMREHCFTFLKVDSLMLTIIACILCLAAFTCASFHLSNLYSPTTKCASTNIFIANASCICIFGAKDTNFTPPNGTTSANRTEEYFSGGYEFHYKDLSCNEVNGAWRILLMVSIVLNVLGFFMGSCYILLSCFKKKDKRKVYNPVRTDLL